MRTALFLDGWRRRNSTQKNTPSMYSQYTADVFTVHRRCIHGTPPMYSKYTADVLKVHGHCTPHATQRDLNKLQKVRFSVNESKRAQRYCALFSLKDLENSKEGFIFASEK